MMGVKNKYTEALEQDYEEEVSKYTVEPPTFDDEEDSMVNADELFGGDT